MTKKIKEEIKEEIKREIDTEVKDELKNELKDELKNELKGKMKEEIKEELIGDTSKDISKKGKTMYVEGSGLFQLCESDLSKEEALLVQGKVYNGEYGPATHWYRKNDADGAYSVWQRILNRDNMDSNEVATCKATASYIIQQKGDKDDISKIVKDIEESLQSINRDFPETIMKLNVLYGLVGGLYITVFMGYLYYILKVSNVMMSLYFLVIIIFVVFTLWLNCECKRCHF